MANADRRPARKSKYVEVELTFPRGLIEAIDQIVTIGILGTTRDEVLTHILRQAIFEEYFLRARKEKG